MHSVSPTAPNFGNVTVEVAISCSCSLLWGGGGDQVRLGVLLHRVTQGSRVTKDPPLEYCWTLQEGEGELQVATGSSGLWPRRDVVSVLIAHWENGGADRMCGSTTLPVTVPVANDSAS